MRGARSYQTPFGAYFGSGQISGRRNISWKLRPGVNPGSLHHIWGLTKEIKNIREKHGADVLKKQLIAKKAAAKRSARRAHASSSGERPAANADRVPAGVPIEMPQGCSESELAAYLPSVPGCGCGWRPCGTQGCAYRTQRSRRLTRCLGASKRRLNYGQPLASASSGHGHSTPRKPASVALGGGLDSLVPAPDVLGAHSGPTAVLGGIGVCENMHVHLSLRRRLSSPHLYWTLVAKRAMLAAIALATHMPSLWVRFARGGAPSLRNLPEVQSASVSPRSGAPCMGHSWRPSTCGARESGTIAPIVYMMIHY